MINEFKEYMSNCSKGKILAEKICIEGDGTHYMIMNKDMMITFRNLKILSAHRYYYSDKTSNNIIVNRIIVICTSITLPIVKLCEEVDDVIIVNENELDYLDDYARTPTCEYKLLFPNEKNDNDLFQELFDLPRYVFQLRIPKQIVESKKSKFKVPLKSIEFADNLIKAKNIDVDKTLIIINFSENKNFVLDKEIWNDLISYVRKNNYDIFSFVRTEDEILCGTIPINLSIDVLFALILRGCKVVSFQNILTDLMRVLDSQLLKAVVVFNINENTKQQAINFDLNSQISQFKKIRYVGNNNHQNGLISELILKNFNDIFDDSFNNEFKYYSKAFNIANEICSNDPEIHYIIFNVHIGDAMYGTNLVKFYREYHSKLIKLNEKNEQCSFNIKKIVVITNPLLSGVARLCKDVDDIIVLDSNIINLLNIYANLDNCPHKNLVPDRKDEWFTNDMYGFNAHLIKLMLPKNEFGSVISDYEIPKKNQENAKKFFLENNIIPKKTLILVPYAQTSPCMKQNDFQLLIDYCNEKGYTIYTNCGSKQEPLKGTKKLLAPVDDFCAIIQQGAYIVGVQCGLMDTLVWLNDDKIFGIIINLIINGAGLSYANERNILNPITEKGNFTHIRKDELEIEALDKQVLREFKRKYENNVY